MTKLSRRQFCMTGLALARAAPLLTLDPASAQQLKGGTLRVAVLSELANFDPQQLSTVNFHVIKNLYDSLIEYTPEGKPQPSLATEWTISSDKTSVSLTLRDGVTFHSGAPFKSDSVLATLQKGADPKRGKNVFSTMAIVKERFPGILPQAEFRLQWANFCMLDKMLVVDGYRDLPDFQPVLSFLRGHADEIIHSAYFARSRRIAMRALKYSVPAYRFLLLRKTARDYRQ